mmetsp:Transcript_27360/g.63833  ORF Transcript_27360/g.63833 Transcript_27360/m.63833 type:complete len:309 (+) Transcript_27360:121-1047(+)|eukprot:CAMPEP_0178372636 /NCGR_PEP_ID=MMETSP0689_2-20121128/1455_1 /TAXON_ID=160604 /ORGANISM="Amphidinium massartii, Strain CS-259" /LENGTH=308 /DNA_ID=CAMNT_0019992565 /DNA_START=23 /DNA_END=949 /DNA_ORIENTATION=-
MMLVSSYTGEESFHNKSAAAGGLDAAMTGSQSHCQATSYEAAMRQVCWHGPQALDHVPEELLSNRNFIMEALEHSPYAIKYASEALRSDRHVVMEALRNISRRKQDGREDLLSNVSGHLRSNRDFMLEAVRCSPASLQYASEELQADREIVASALAAFPQQTARILQHAAEEILQDADFLWEALYKAQAINHIDSNCLRFCKDVSVLEAIAQRFHGYLLRVSTLSGRFCIVVCGYCTTVYQVRQACCRFLDVDVRKTATRLVVDGCIMSSGLASDMPGMRHGRLNDVQLILRTMETQSPEQEPPKSRG